MRNNKHGKKWLRQLALAAGVALACTSQPAHAGFGTAELVSTTISQIPDCLDYRILGLSLRVIWTPYGPYYFWTLHVGHTVPAMVNQSHPYLDEMPWEEYSMLLGTAYREASEAIVHVGFLGLANNVEIGAGRYKHHKFGRHYAPQHYESAVIGHPAMIIFQRTGGGNFFCQYVFRHAGDGVVKQAAVFLQADERALPALAIVVFDDEVCALVAVEGNQQVIPHAVGNDAVRPDAGGKVGDLVIRAIDRLDVLCGTCGFDVVLA